MGITRTDLIEYIKQHGGTAITLRLRRGGDQTDLAVTPVLKGDVAVIGANLSYYEVRTIEPGPLQAIQMSLERNWEWSRLIVQTLVGLFTRETSMKQLMGPVAIAEMSGGAAQLGWIALFNLMAMISLNLGLLNLMPIPVLDGGHITFMLIEGAVRRPLPYKFKLALMQVGLVVLMGFMLFVTINDVDNLWGFANIFQKLKGVF